MFSAISNVTTSATVFSTSKDSQGKNGGVIDRLGRGVYYKLISFEGVD